MHTAQHYKRVFLSFCHSCFPNSTFYSFVAFSGSFKGISGARVFLVAINLAFFDKESQVSTLHYSLHDSGTCSCTLHSPSCYSKRFLLFFYSFSMGFLCTLPRTDLFGQVMLHLAACPCFAEPQQNEDCGGPEAGLKSMKHLHRLQSHSFLLALEIFSSKSIQVPGCVSTE